MSLSLEKAQQRQRKKVAGKKKVAAKRSLRPWQSHQVAPAPTLATKTPNTSRLKTWLHQPKTFSFMGLSLEIGSRTRLHLPPLNPRRR